LWWRHYLKVVRVDNERMEILSNERGRLIRTWNHWIKIDRSADRKPLYMDRIEIEAGMEQLRACSFLSIQTRTMGQASGCPLPRRLLKDMRVQLISKVIPAQERKF